MASIDQGALKRGRVVFALKMIGAGMASLCFAVVWYGLLGWAALHATRSVLGLFG